MMTNKMLLSSVQEEGIPYKPFPEGEEKKVVFLSTETILSVKAVTPCTASGFTTVILISM